MSRVMINCVNSSTLCNGSTPNPVFPFLSVRNQLTKLGFQDRPDTPTRQPLPGLEENLVHLCQHLGELNDLSVGLQYPILVGLDV